MQCPCVCLCVFVSAPLQNTHLRVLGRPLDRERIPNIGQRYKTNQLLPAIFFYPPTNQFFQASLPFFLNGICPVIRISQEIQRLRILLKQRNLTLEIYLGFLPLLNNTTTCANVLQ